MAKRTTVQTSFTPTGVNDAANITDGTYFAAWQGGSGTQRVVFTEFMLTGQAAASAPSIMLVARDSTVGATLSLGSGLTDAPMDSATAALAAPVGVFNTATTKPQRSSSLKLLNLSFNAFGGIVKWTAKDGEEIAQAGQSVNTGETSLTCLTGGSPGLMGAHCIYEPW